MFDYLFNDQFSKEDQHINTFLWQETQSQQICFDLSQIDDMLFSLPSYAQIFMTSFVKLIHRKLNPLSTSKISENYDKDDEDCSLFVFSVTNLRIINFRNQS